MMLEHAPHVSPECLIRAQVQLNWIEDMNRLSVLAERGEFDLLNRELDRHKAYFKGVKERPEHPERTFITGEQAEAIVGQLDRAKLSAEKKFTPWIPLLNLRRTFFNIAVDRAVACECDKQPPESV